jgi:HPt (histidine-containing phosphotransfer) domain-containing protein/PAS domain-containing protein
VRSVDPQSRGAPETSIKAMSGRARAAHRPLAAGALLVVLLGLALAWLWQKTQSMDLEDHSHLDAALRELRSLDRTINQDVVRARYKLIDTYDPVLLSYRRVEELEMKIAIPPRFLDQDAQRRLAEAVRDYRVSVTVKQRLIERVKYRGADLRDLLDYLPGAGTALATAASHSGDAYLGDQVNHVLQLVLLYNLTSDNHYAPVIGLRLNLLSASAERADSPVIRRRLRTLVTNIHRLLTVKPAVDALLLQILDQPIIQHENEVASIYYDSYAAAERAARSYRVVLYALCIGLVLLVGYGVRRVQHNARALVGSNELLEERVVERTRELRAVLDNVEQALFTVDRDGRIARERSAVLDAWFPHAQAGGLLWDVFAAVDPAASEWLAAGWEQLRDGVLPADVALDQLPAVVTSVTTGRRYRVEYRPIGDPMNPVKLLVVVSDVTVEVERERREAEQHEHLMLFQHIMIDGPNFEEAFAEIDRLVHQAVGRRRPERDALLRGLHTVKGNAGMYGLVSLARLCHALETKLIDGASDLDDHDVEQLTEVWATLADKVGVLVGMAPRDRLEVTRGDLVQVEEAVSAGCPPAEVMQLVRYLSRDPIERRLSRFAEQARQLAQRLNKGDVEVNVEANGVRLDGRRWAPFWSAFVHLLRNALDHGLEPPAERQQAGKSATGRLTLTTRDVDGQIVIEFADDGRGIDWDAVRAKARKLGSAAETQQDLQAALLRGGLSTRAEASELSGRGAGVAACFCACRDLGGTMSIASVRGGGTTFRFAIPGDDAVVPRLTSVA